MPARLFTLLALFVALPVRAADDDTTALAISSGESIFVAKLTKVTAGPVGLSEPPVRSYTFEAEPSDVLRGKKPTGALAYQIRSKAVPSFPLDEKWLIAARRQDKGWQVTFIGVADEALLKKARALAVLPAGWSLDGDKPVSPWAALKDRAWPKGAPKATGAACSKTGRPALLAGEGIEFTVEQVPAKDPKKYMNDLYGDGQFKLTVKNTGDKPVDVPALLTDGKTIFWADSVVLMVNHQPKLLGHAGRATDTKPVHLKPGESVSGVIDTLSATGVDWPKGGQRVYFDFGLGEKSTSNFFYYHFRVHDAMREAALKKLDEK
jgi:hypothetical protein